ncbi:hypothetical protein EDD96_4543 [Streptomyces sp. Ag109_G2-6]|uniref:hypothetical protein n=1 Tax=Streptomyces TaxID=1883 RepID=UPI0009A5043C|nr:MULTISPECIES: hypothetical protein [Streptomyces]RPF40766.1 hypothetical protein EDD96_4543 [Streptomyces sp. Ag109_G2-6]
MPAQPAPAAGTDLAGLKAVIAAYDALRESAHAEASAVITAGSRLRAMIVTKQIISSEASELLEAAYAEVSEIIAIAKALAGALADFGTTA